MHKLIVVFLMLIVNLVSAAAPDTLQQKSEITDVTVFFSGAEITREAEVNYAKGKHIIVFDNLPAEVQGRSIQVNNLPASKILSVKHEFVQPRENKKEKAYVDLENKIRAEEQKVKELKNKYKVFSLEETILLDNSKLGNKEQGASIGEIKQAADFYRQRLNEIRQGKLEIINSLDDADERMKELYSELNQMTYKERTAHSRIMIAFDCEKEVRGKLKVSYFVSSAGWAPAYEFRVEDITRPLTIVYNANVYQSSGEAWNNVNINLSTSNPTLKGEKPLLKTWNIGEQKPKSQVKTEQGHATFKGRILDASNEEALAFANIALEKNGVMVNGAMTDIDGQFIIKPISSGYYTVKINYLGYQSLELGNVYLSADIVNKRDFKLNSMGVELKSVEITNANRVDKGETRSGAALMAEEIEAAPTRDVRSAAALTAGVTQVDDGDYVNVRGSRGEATEYYVDGMRIRGSQKVPQSAIEQQVIVGGNPAQYGRSSGGITSIKPEISNYISNSLKTNATNLEYKIEIPYSVPADGEDYSIKIKEVSLPVTYVYHAVPKIDNDVFLTARITDWSQLNLLSGKSSIFYQGTYTGESYIDVDQVEDTLTISLGRDNSIVVERVSNKKIYDKKTSGGNIKETTGWEINVRNNKNSRINLVVEDQFPVSDRKSIEIEKLEYSDARLDQNTGLLTWVIELDAAAKKTLTYSYSVKYPKYANLSVE